MQKPAIKLIGLSLGRKTSNQNGQSAKDCGMLWEKFQNEKIVERIPQKLGEEIYAVYHDYDGDHTQPYSYFIGCRVPEDAEVPEGLDTLRIAGSKYHKITAKGAMPSCVADAWQKIWKSDADLPRTYKADFEVYDERSHDWENAEVDIFLGVE